MTPTDAKIAEVASRQASAFSRSQLYESGGNRELLRRRLAAGVWRRETEDVFSIAGAPRSWRLELWVGLLQAGSRAAISRRSALALRGLRGFVEGPVDIVRHERYEHGERGSDLHVTSWLPPHHITEVDGLPCTTLPCSLFHLAGMASPKRRRRGWPWVPRRVVARAVADARVHLGLEPLDVERIVAELGRRGRPGTTLMRQLAAEHAAGTVATESELEDLLLRVATAYALPLPERQVVMRRHGETTARVDFCYLPAQLVIECDGRKYHSALQDMDRDRWRSNELAADGWRVIRVSWFDLVHQPERVVALIRRALRRAGVPTTLAA